MKRFAPADNYGKDSVIGLNSKDEVVIVYRRDDGSDDIYISVGNRGSWTHSWLQKTVMPSYLAVAIDSNDDMHISSHNSNLAVAVKIWNISLILAVVGCEQP